MDPLVRRAMRALVALCLALVPLAIASSAKSAPPLAGELLVLRPGRLPIFAYRPTATDAPKPLTIYLHGICGRPENGCPFFKDGVTDASWLVCPSAPTPCPEGGASWSSSTSRVVETILRAEEDAVANAPSAIDTERPRVLIGFSQGGYRVPDLLRAQPGRYRSVLVLAADAKLTKAALDQAGVRKLALGAGRYDQTFRPLRARAEALAREGFLVRFVDLGKVGHTYVPEEGTDAMRETLAWLEAAE